MLISTTDFLATKAANPVSSFTASEFTADATFLISKSALNPTKTAAKPTNACIPATSSGICVISTLAAKKYPITPPAAIRRTDRAHKPEPGPIKVANTARAIPKMPYHTARLALSCPDNPPRDSINNTAATTYAAVVNPNSIFLTP